MKVLQCHNNYRVEGGEDVFFRAIVRLLKQHGVDVCVVVRDSKTIGSSLGARVCAFFSGIYSFREEKHMRYILKREQPDIVHIHNIYPLLSPAVLVACYKMKVPVFVTFHNYRYICPTGLCYTKNRTCEKCKTKKVYWCIIHNCRNNVLESIGYAVRNLAAHLMKVYLDKRLRIIVVSSFAKQKVMSAGIPEKRIAVLPNMVTIPPKKAGSKEYCGYIGRVSREKGIDVLLAASEILSDIPFKIIGKCDASFENTENICNNHPNVIFTGHVTGQQLGIEYATLRLLVFPTKMYECCPLVLLEAMSYGIPIIASRIGCVPDIVEDGVTGVLFEPGSVKDLSGKIKALWDDEIACERMGAAAREKAITCYSEEHYIKRLMELYQFGLPKNAGKGYYELAC